jgi:hypothetical protein
MNGPAKYSRLGATQLLCRSGPRFRRTRRARRVPRSRRITPCTAAHTSWARASQRPLHGPWRSDPFQRARTSWIEAHRRQCPRGRPRDLHQARHHRSPGSPLSFGSRRVLRPHPQEAHLLCLLDVPLEEPLRSHLPRLLRGRLHNGGTAHPNQDGTCFNRRNGVGGKHARGPAPRIREAAARLVRHRVRRATP